ncbi:RagB/SusD family nutrient uptake outer membrane protein [Niabella beijingensis]|uniref:RagB/SusD family nutrient uptake outer membrane protein n=1 Tax=Niabella beijingensis TaxID=2872700 RepID=UPI001CBE353B|nr:RagB/SusD family nutrient uptake outer membrane protein [Niabella beijingensis]MBZ4191943.1 RagB/SusD family nutrient uptake outer membrane protein [Niabella beijingensis]
MIQKRRIYIAVLGFALLSFSSCKKFLEEKIYSQLAPDNFLNTEDGIKALLNDAYARAANMNTNNSIYVIAPQEWTTDILYQSGDNVERDARNFINFSWDPTIDFIGNNWDAPYQAIRDANLLLNNIGTVPISDPAKASYTAEFRFLRAISYYKLYFFFGPVPLRTETTKELQLKRATDDEMKAFIESELSAVAAALPDPGGKLAYGRAHRAAALGFLCKFYLNTKQWQKCADIADQIISGFDYALFNDYQQLFSVANERNKEYIWVRPALASSDRATANSWMNTAFPDNFSEAPSLGVKFLSTYVNWPNEFRIYDAFYNSFEPGDKRRSLLVTYYINTSGQTISLLGSDNIRSFKYLPDPNAMGASHGNDIPEIRYADILLARAEALNELNGPAQAALGLINQVRTRAGLKNLLLTDYPTKESLRDHILAERGWEFFSEGQRRMDLIRMDKFISGARQRGKTNAQPFHVYFPIPQVVMDSDPLLIQNEGY